MNELRKYATFSVDFVGQPIKVNSMFSFGRARIFYMGSNPNRSIIEGEAFYHCTNLSNVYLAILINCEYRNLQNYEIMNLL